MSRESRKKDMVRANTPSDLNTGGGWAAFLCVLLSFYRGEAGRGSGEGEKRGKRHQRPQKILSKNRVNIFFLLGDYIGQVTMWLRMVGAVTPCRMRCEASTRPTQSSMARNTPCMG